MLLLDARKEIDGPGRGGCLATNLIVPVASATLERPVPYFAIIHPPPQCGLPAS